MNELGAKIYDQPHILGHFLGYDKLTEDHGKWIKEFWTATKDVWKQAHRGSFKTTAVTVVGPIWRHLFKAEDRILLSRKTYTNSCDTLEEIAGHYRGPKIKELYRKVRGIDNFRLRVDRRGRIVLPTKKEPSKEGSIDCAGRDTKVTGSHFEFLINDDLDTIKDMVSKAEREATRYYRDEQQNVRNPGGVIGNLGTPWHQQDGWHRQNDDGQWEDKPGIIKHPIGTLAIPGFTPEYLLQLKGSMSAPMYARNYLLHIIADSERLFPDPVEAKEWPKRCEGRAYEDPAYKGTHFTAVSVIGFWEGKYYATGKMWRKDSTTICEEVAEFISKYNTGTLYVESNADKGWCAKEMRKYWPAVMEVNEVENKHIKILTYAVKNFRLLHWIPETQPEYMAQVLDYREGEEPDDAPDSLASLIRAMRIGMRRRLEDRY